MSVVTCGPSQNNYRLMTWTQVRPLRRQEIYGMCQQNRCYQGVSGYFLKATALVNQTENISLRQNYKPNTWWSGSGRALLDKSLLPFHDHWWAGCQLCLNEWVCDASCLFCTRSCKKADRRERNKKTGQSGWLLDPVIVEQETECWDTKFIQKERNSLGDS